MVCERGMEFEIEKPYEAALESVTAALTAEGFGIISRIDVRAGMKERLHVECLPLVVIGACNPPVPSFNFGDVVHYQSSLPCNVSIEATPTGLTRIHLSNPLLEGECPEDPILIETARLAGQKIQAVAQHIIDN